MSSPPTAPRSSASPDPGSGENGNPNNNPTRRTSLGFLRRAKSTERLGERKSSGKMSKRLLKEQAKEEQLRRQREAAAISMIPPQLPDIHPPPQINTFGGEAAQQDSPGRSKSSPTQSPPPVPPIPFMHSFPRAESMAHRGRYSYASSAVSTINSPRRVRRRKDPTPYK